VRERDLPAHVVVYYVIALALYMRSSYREVLRCLLEGVPWLLHPSARIRGAGKSGISQARSRLGVEPVKKLYEAVVSPIAEKRTRGAWYRQWRLVSLDAAPWMWRTPRRTSKPSAGREPPRIERLSQDSFRRFAGERHPRTVGGMHGPI
jgi:hypothetical protein